MLPNLTADRRKAIERARAILARQPVYLDTETTGLDPLAEIVEVCVLDHDGRPLIDRVVRPTTPIPTDAARVHGITDEAVRGAPTWVQLWPEVAAALEGRVVAIYNAAFDTRLMRQSHRAHALPWADPTAGAVCIMELFAQFHGQWSGSHGSYRWQSLERAGRLCGLSLPNAHRAADDARLARAVLHAMASSDP